MAFLYLFCLATFPVVISANDQPEFGTSLYVVNNLKEKSPIGTLVLNVTAVDANGDEITYVLGGDAKSKFLINNKTGEIFVNAVLTKKEYPNRITFDVSAYDSINGPEYKSTAAVYVILVDINDNTPQFLNQPFHADVSENANIGVIVLQVTAKDGDLSSKYGLISYNIYAGNEEGKFAITTYTGHITVVDTLSFDKTTKYILNVSATDGGGKQNLTTVSIDVLDYDNLPAVFDQRQYLASVPENASRGFSVIQVSAHDGDSLNASVEYILDPVSDKNNKFIIDNTTGVITVNGSLDRELTSSYLLRIGAKSTYHTAVYTTVSVQVIDVNDNGPVFEKSLYSAFVPENSPVDLTVLQVTATDADVGKNSALQYVLTGANDKFDIRSSGHIVVKANIDREEKSQYKFVVTAQETSTAQRYESNATVVINITDVNDHNPKCSQDVYKVTVHENRPNGTFVAQVVGIDSDAGKNAEIRFSFESDLDGHANYFTLDPLTGNITTLQALDRETTHMFTLTVTLRDQAEVEQKRSGSCFVQITVGDQNDNTPKFISLLNVTSVAEDSPPGTTVVTIKAQDDDVSSNAQVEYSIVSSNVNNTFHLNTSSGILTTRKTLDRESLEQYNLVVSATDSGGKSQTEVVIVTVLDTNDNTPQFNQPQGYSFSVDENSAALLVGIVQASDADLGSNADINYSIDPSSSSNKFTIEATTGTIKTAVPLDRETTDTYTLTVIAEDKGSPSLSANVTVYINVSDVNDNSPHFAHGHYTVSLEENGESRVFLNLTASDKDLGINSQLHYRILSGNSAGYFAVDGSTGELSTTKSLDYETEKTFTLLVLVYDLDGNDTYGEPFRDHAVVYVSVKDVNDHAPVFTQTSYTARLHENVTIGSEVILVRAADQDSNVNHVVEYSFTRGNVLGKFFIDTNSGRITVKDTIDRDPPSNQTTFNITVMAKDNGNPSLNSTVQLFIEVDDVNDNPPTFSQVQYTVQLPENSVVGTSLIQLHCVDVDNENNGKFWFTINTGVDKIKPEFRIDNITGLITSLVVIDYDLGNHEYRLVIDATDEGQPQLIGSTTVIINVENVNDNSPQFSQPSYSFSIKEGSYVGLDQFVGKVTAAELDYDGKSPYGQVFYSFENKSSVFSVTNVTGEISTNAVLDRELSSHFTLKILAEDGDNTNPRSNSTLVYISILDVNDNAPEFTKSRQTIHVSEDVPAGFSVVNVTAVDPDEGLNGDISYSILSGNTDSYFLFNDLTGELKTNKVLDRETDDNYALVIQAHDKGTPSSNSLAFVTVVVDDVNDNAPVITATTYASTIRENLPSGQLVCKVSALDEDDGVNQAISYSLNFPEFAVNSSGFVYTTKSLDRENVAGYDIEIVATDHGTPTKSSSVIVKVGVEDINDNSPVFKQELYSVLISENTTIGFRVIQVTATDRDSGINAELTYSMSGGDGHFKINRTTGLISMVTPVDHESNPVGFVVFVTASDRGIPSEKSTTVQVNIGVSDVNDNSPVFEKFGYETSVNESSPLGTMVVRVVATDRDQGLLGEVAYDVIDGNIGGAFSVNNSGFIVVSGKLDRENQEFYELSVKATDKAGLPKSAQTKVNIRVLDLNDNPPVIHNAPVELEVNETTPINTILFTVVTSDRDLRETNGQLSFNGLAGDGVLEVNTNTGAVELISSLDYAVKQRHILPVFAADHGVPSLSSPIVNVSVVVIKKDSNVPLFEHPSYTFNITEDTGVDNVIGHLQASQRNPVLGSSIVYAIKSGNSAGLFHVNQQGTLSLIKSLDRESNLTYTIIVTATNSQESSQVGHTVVTIVITDVNDSPPVFQYENYQSEVNEDASADTTVIVVEAFDPDADVSAELQYSFISGNEDGKFKIETKTIEGDNVGVVILVGALDRETTEYYTMKIFVTDGKFHNNCTLRIRVKDINDNDPIFNPSSYQASVPENTAAGFTVVRVTAVDADIHENADVSYSITGEEDNFFIEKNSGEIKTTDQPLDRETKSSYAFQVTASDIDGRKGTANVLITVSDENDNAPVFDSSSYTTHIIEGPGSKAGGAVITVQATDDDSGDNKIIVYSIKDGNVGGTFAINNITGEITVANAVDRELAGLTTNAEGHRMFSMTVMATDRGSPPLATSTPVNIIVGDINDNIPTFPPSGYSFMISRDAMANMVVITVMATDKDDDENGRVTYGIAQGNTGGDFSIDLNMGVLRTVNNLQRAVGFQYNVTIQATDHGSPSLSSTTIVFLTVGETNDHFPVLNPQNYTINIYENNLPNLAVLNVTATDADEGQNAEITYSISRGNNQSLFTLVTESNYARLIVDRLDREMQDQYILEIMAEDGGIPLSRKATGFITVMVLDLNDNAPQFSDRNYTGSLAENSGPDIVVQMVHPISTTDKDLGINADIVYSISGPGSEQFVIDRTTAVLRTRGSPLPTLDYESSSSYTFNVIATDQASNGLSSSVPVTIKLIDENDNTPVFSPSVLRVSIPESTSVGDVIATVAAIDPDLGVNGEVSYSIISGAQGMFAVDEDDGEFRVLYELDREQHEVYSINISAIDGNLYPRQGFGLVVITLLDNNDNYPVFEKLEYTTTVAEDVPVGHDVVTVRAVDLDEGVNSNISYYLDHPVYHVDRNSGVIRTKTTLDRETVDSYSLSVRAVDGGGLETSVTVNIIVSDVNDNAPFFPKNDQYRSIVSENTTVGSDIVWIVAEDADEGKNAELRYSLAQNVGDLFEIDSQTGMIRSNSSLDKAQLISKGLVNNTGLIQLKIQVRDGGTPARSSYQTTIIQVVSATDELPVFDQSFYHFNVSEDAEIGNSVGTVKALSKSASSILKYSFKSEQLNFKINENDGQITTAVSLNEADLRYYIFTVRVTDGLSNSGYSSVVVTVLDVNDHSPLFQFMSPYTMSISEDVKPGSGVGVLKATDKDWGENARITYKFVEANVGPNGSMVPVDNSCIMPLGLEKEVVFGSDMTASSSYSEPNKDFSATQGRLNHKPVMQAGVEHQGAWCSATNDVKPFLQVDFKRLKKITKVATQGRPGGPSYVTKYVLSHSLDGNTWTPHEQVLVGNKDSESVVIRHVLPAFQSRYVRLHPVSWFLHVCLRAEFYGCNSDGGDDMSIPFIVDEATGMVNVSDYLDRESQEKYTIIVEASDSGHPVLRSNTTLEIHILDHNDNAPVFDKTAYHVTLSENTFGGDVVIRVSAADRDSGSNGELTYSIVSGSRGKFRIEASTGTIQPAARLDYEDTKDRHFTLDVLAADHGTPQLSSHVAVYINISDFNDNYPVFNASSLVAEIQENLNPGTFITKVQATDMDSGDNSLIRYSFIEASDKFSIDSTSGVVETSQRLDREDVGSYLMKVRGTDSGDSPLSTDAKLFIKITDVNDNPPTFTERVYTRRIMEDSAVNAVVVTVKAEDQDVGLNGQVVYRISKGNDKGLFRLDNLTGIISVAKSLDREVNQTMSFTVVGQDQSAPFYRDEAEVVVMVTDVNDNAPVIEPREMRVVINEDVAIGTFIVDVNATDKDSSSNAQLEYFLVHGSSGHFKIDPKNGIVTTATELDFETISHYTVLVMVRDTGVTGYMDFGSIDVTLLDVNDNGPEFLPIDILQVFENQPSGTEVGVVQAKDVDTGSNTDISFAITAGDPKKNFAIGALSGVISTTKLLDREATPFYDLQITASNLLGTPVLSTSITVRVDVQDINDNAPKFNASFYHGAVSENASTGEVIARVFALDPDQGKAGTVSYRILDGLHSSLVSINNQTGTLTLRQSLIEKEYRNFTIMVEAKDDGNPSLSTNVPVIITVQDINDNSPKFGKDLYSANVSEVAVVGDRVVQMIASDEDTAGSGGTSYELVYGNELGHFRISAQTGWVYVNESLDREINSQYRLGVRASNTVGKRRRRRRRKRNTPFSDTTELEIVIDDANDNIPAFEPLFYVGGVMPGADVGTLIVKVTATDADTGLNSQLAFNISSGDEDNRFYITDNVGSILATDVAVGTPGSLYTLKVVAIDNLGKGSASLQQAIVKIYVISPSQQVIILSHIDPSMVKNNTDEFIRMLSNITDSQAYIDKIYKVYTRDDQGKKQASTEVLFHVVRNFTILPNDEILRTVDLNRYLLNTTYVKWKIEKVSKVTVKDDDDDDELAGWEIALIVLGVILALIILLLCCFFFCCLGWKRRLSEETVESPNRTFFTNSPVTRQRDSLSDSTHFYSSSFTAGRTPFTESQNVSNPVYCADIDSDGYEEKEVELSLSDEESDQESGKRASKKGTSFKKSFRK